MQKKKNNNNNNNETYANILKKAYDFFCQITIDRTRGQYFFLLEPP